MRRGQDYVTSRLEICQRQQSRMQLINKFTIKKQQSFSEHFTNWKHERQRIENFYIKKSDLKIRNLKKEKEDLLYQESILNQDKLEQEKVLKNNPKASKLKDSNNYIEHYKLCQDQFQE